MGGTPIGPFTSTASCSSPPSASVETNFTYTTNGERDSATTTTGSGTTTTAYAWNPYGELCNASTTTTACGSTPANGTSYTYNGDGLRTSATASTSTTSTASIAAVGALQDASGSGQSTLSVDPQHVGDALVLGVEISGTLSTTVTSVSGGGATWQKITDSGSDAYAGIDGELWVGTVTTTGSSTITVSYSASVSSQWIVLAAQEYSSSAGASTTWDVDTSGDSHNDTSSTTVTFPSLTPSDDGELYVGYGGLQHYGVAGSTTGFTYDAASTGLFIYDTDVTGTVSPTGGQSPAGDSVAAGGLPTSSRR
jgi:YD repeat-containing protein